MLDVKSNFKNLYENDLTCRTCKKICSAENEDHILECEFLVTEIDIKVEYEFVYIKPIVIGQKNYILY